STSRSRSGEASTEYRISCLPSSRCRLGSRVTSIISASTSARTATINLQSAPTSRISAGEQRCKRAEPAHWRHRFQEYKSCHHLYLDSNVEAHHAERSEVQLREVWLQRARIESGCQFWRTSRRS